MEYVVLAYMTYPRSKAFMHRITSFDRCHVSLCFGSCCEGVRLVERECGSSYSTRNVSSHACFRPCVGSAVGPSSERLLLALRACELLPNRYFLVFLDAFYGHRHWQRINTMFEDCVQRALDYLDLTYSGQRGCLVNLLEKELSGVES